MRDSNGQQQLFRIGALCAMLLYPSLLRAQDEFSIQQHGQTGQSNDSGMTRSRLGEFRYRFGLDMQSAHYVNRDADAWDKHRTAFGARIGFSSVPLRRDAEHATDASLNVIPKSELTASIMFGPRYEQQPEEYDPGDAAWHSVCKVSGAAQFSSGVACGAQFQFFLRRHSTRVYSQAESIELLNVDQSDFIIAPMAVFSLSPKLRISEAVGYGEYAYRVHIATPHWSETTGKSHASLGILHTLSLSLCPGFGYEHTLAYAKYSDWAGIFDFQHRFEIPISVSVVPALRVGYWQLTYDNYLPASKQLTIGADVSVFPVSTIMVRAQASYVRAIDQRYWAPFLREASHANFDARMEVRL
jgi:hypothetical protein